MGYLEQKRNKILQEIKPICDAFGISDYDYVVQKECLSERLRIYDIYICCTSNSLYAVKQELVGYLFMCYWRERSLGAFDKQTRDVIKQFWREKD